MSEYPKHIKKLIRYYATLAHEEELRRALEFLAAKFDEWRAGNWQPRVEPSHSDV